VPRSGRFFPDPNLPGDSYRLESDSAGMLRSCHAAAINKRFFSARPVSGSGSVCTDSNLDT